MLKDQKERELALAIFKILEPAEMLFNAIVENNNYIKRIELFRVTTNDYGVTIGTLLLKSHSVEEGLIVHSLHISKPSNNFVDSIV